MYRHINPAAETYGPRSRAYEQGKYGRLFPWLPPQSSNIEEDKEDFKKIAKAMLKGRSKFNVATAGYTYFGQFIAHDLTFDPTSIGERQVDPECLWNFRTPALDLDSLYGSGPLAEPIYYDSNQGNIRTKFRLEKTKGFYDLPRVTGKNGKRFDAIIPDQRNDENIIVSQLHFAFMKLHNILFERELKKNKKIDREILLNVFLKTQQLVRWRFQYVTIHDYLKTVVDGKNIVTYPSSITNEILNGNGPNCPKLKFFDWRNEPFMPLEFSTAVFRFGHSQIKGCYDFNDQEPQKLLFSARRKGREPFTYVDWSKFFFNKESSAGNLGNGIMNKISQQITPLPDVTTPLEISLPYRNLVKGLMMELPSGQSVANAMGIKPIDDRDFSIFPKDFSKKLREKYKNNTPLWYYILLEGAQNEGQKLGDVGGKIVAEVIIGLILGDKTSFLNQFPNWKPSKENDEPYQDYSIIDMLEEANIYHGALA